MSDSMKQHLTAGSMLLPRWTQSMDGWRTHLSSQDGALTEMMWRPAEILDGGDIVISRLFPRGEDTPFCSREAGALEVLRGLLTVTVYKDKALDLVARFTLGRNAVFEFAKGAWLSVTAMGLPTLSVSYTRNTFATSNAQESDLRPLDDMSAAILLEDARCAVTPLDALSQASIS